MAPHYQRALFDLLMERGAAHGPVGQLDVGFAREPGDFGQFGVELNGAGKQCGQSESANAGRAQQIRAEPTKHANDSVRSLG